MPVENFEPQDLPNSAYDLYQIKLQAKTRREQSEEALNLSLIFDRYGFGEILQEWESPMRLVFGIIPKDAEARHKLQTKIKFSFRSREYEITKMNPDYLINCINAVKPLTKTPAAAAISDLTRDEAAEKPQTSKPAAADFSDLPAMEIGKRDPKCQEDLLPDAMIVQYCQINGPPIGIDEPEVEAKLKRMGSFGFVWKTKLSLYYEFIPKSDYHRKRMNEYIAQKIGDRLFSRNPVEFAVFFKRLEDYEHSDTSMDESDTQEDVRQDTAESSSADADGTMQPPTKKAEQTANKPSSPPDAPKTVGGTQTPTETEAIADTIHQEPPLDHGTQSAEQPQDLDGSAQMSQSHRFRPRRHPATYQPPHQQREPATCLLFRPQTAASLHTHRTAVARCMNSVKPRPVAVRCIRGGGLAMDFPLGQDLEAVLAITSLAEIPVQVEPPRLRQGSSGVIRGDFLAAEEVFELYSIHSENPTMTKVEQLGDRKVFRLFFTDTRPDSVKLFFNQVHVEPYIQHPLRCYHCQGFNHRAADCKRPAYCSLCACPGHTHKDCQKQQVRCVNCGGPHAASHKTCPHRLFHLSVAKTAASSGIPYREARLKTASSYADAVKTNTTKTSSKNLQHTDRTQTATRTSSSTMPSKSTAVLKSSTQSNDLAQLFLSIAGLLFPDQQIDMDTLNKAITTATGGKIAKH